MDQERSFVCFIMKTLFRKFNKCFPEEFQSILDQCDTIENITFNNNIKEAVEILMDDEDSKVNQIDVHWDSFDDETQGIESSFDCRNFLNICVRYLYKALDDYFIDGTTDSLFKVYNRLLDVLKKNKDMGVFNNISWAELSTIAEIIVAQEELKRLKQSMQVTESRKHFNEFVLRIMNFIFQLNFKDLPPFLQEILNTFPEHQEINFAPTVRAAVTEIMNDEILASKELGVKYLDYSDNLESILFDEIRFLLDCVRYSKTALGDFCENNMSETPLQVFHFLVEELWKIADKLQHDYTLWNQMTRAALHIMTTYNKRNLGTDVDISSGSPSEILTTVNDLSSESDCDIETSKCFPCKCS